MKKVISIILILYLCISCTKEKIEDCTCSPTSESTGKFIRCQINSVNQSTSNIIHCNFAIGFPLPDGNSFSMWNYEQISGYDTTMYVPHPHTDFIATIELPTTGNIHVKIYFEDEPKVDTIIGRVQNGCDYLKITCFSGYTTIVDTCIVETY